MPCTDTHAGAHARTRQLLPLARASPIAPGSTTFACQSSAQVPACEPQPYCPTAQPWPTAGPSSVCMHLPASCTIPRTAHMHGSWPQRPRRTLLQQAHEPKRCLTRAHATFARVHPPHAMIFQGKLHRVMLVPSSTCSTARSTSDRTRRAASRPTRAQPPPPRRAPWPAPPAVRQKAKKASPSGT